MVEKASKSGHGEKQSRKRELLIAALLTEKTIGGAAAKVGIGENTALRWMQDPDFQEDYREARKMAVSQAISQLQQSTTDAVQTLREIMANKKAPASSRVTAARTVLDSSLKAVELEDLVARVEALERKIRGINC